MHLECNVSAFQGAITTVAEVLSQQNRALGKILMPHEAQIAHPPRESLVPLKNLPGINEIDAILRSVVEAGRKEVHAAIERVLKEWPGRRRDELWARLRQLRNEARERSRSHVTWSEEDLHILRTYYAQGRAGALRAVKELLTRHPDWGPKLIWYKAEKLGISTRPERPRSWSHEEQGYLLWNAGEKPLGRIARKLKRSVAAVHHMMSNRVGSSKLRASTQYTLHRISRLLGVSDAIVRLWFQRGLFGEPANGESNPKRSPSGPRVSAAAIIAFCRKHPDKINTQECHPDFWVLLEDTDVPPNAWHGTRQHLTQERDCPGCERVIRGNAYFHHVKVCQAATTRAARFRPQTETTGQRSESSNV